LLVENSKNPEILYNGVLHAMEIYYPQNNSKLIIAIQIPNLFLGANVNSRKSEDTDGKTPLMVAAVDGTYEIVQYLLEKGADPQMITWVRL
jgi:ankyrin repeat protein